MFATIAAGCGLAAAMTVASIGNIPFDVPAGDQRTVLYAVWEISYPGLRYAALFAFGLSIVCWSCAALRHHLLPVPLCVVALVSALPLLLDGFTAAALPLRTPLRAAQLLLVVWACWLIVHWVRGPGTPALAGPRAQHGQDEAPGSR